MTSPAFSPFGTVRLRLASTADAGVPGHRAGAADRSGAAPSAGGADELYTRDPEHVGLAYLGWDVARAAVDLTPAERRALSALAAATLAAMRSGSTRVPVGAAAHASLDAALEAIGAASELSAARALLERARRDDPAVRGVIGRPSDRTPLVLEGDHLYAERMRVLDERFCGRVRERLDAGRERPSTLDPKALNRALKAVGDGPPPLTAEQRRAVKEALTAPLALVTGGPGTGKTTIVVALLRALAWTGVPMGEVAVAAPTGKAAQRLQQALDVGLAAAAHDARNGRDMAEATLHAIAPAPQTLHRLLGWSPRAGRFARHENDPLPHRVVLVDEASMVDLAMMDRLLRALRRDARLVLLGDAHQLPSIEAGAVFRDLCASLPVARLTTNLRVARDEGAQRIVAAAAAVNAGGNVGELGAAFARAAPSRTEVAALTFEGAELLSAPWADVETALLDRWWHERVQGPDRLAALAARTYRAVDGTFAGPDAEGLRALLDLHARSRLLCATRVRGSGHGAEDLNDRLLARLRGGSPRPRRGRAAELPAGTPGMVQRTDYERQLYNGDQGVVARVAEGPGAPALAAVFLRRDVLEAFPLDAGLDLAPAFAMTVHKAQGSEFDHVALVMPDVDLPLVTRELVYTALTRARRSALVVGEPALLARAVSRRIERSSGIAERLAHPAR